MNREQGQQRESKLQYILELWAGRVDWWQTTFSYPKDFRYQEKEEDKEGAIEPPVEELMMEEAPQRTAGAAEEEAVEPSRDEAKKATEQGEETAPVMSIKAWDPDTPYLEALKRSSAKDRYRVYLQQRDLYGKAPAFYPDCGDYFTALGEKPLGLRIWSNLAEIQLEDAALLRKTMKGEYVIEVNYFSSSAPALSGSVTLQVELFTNYGRSNEQRRAITIRLRESTETLRVGEIRF